MPKLTQEDISIRFAHHPPRDSTIADLHGLIRENCAYLARSLNEALPACRETSLALTHLEEVMMWSNAAVARVLNYANAEREGE